MVYKRYIKRDGKTFGPYYYESYRDDKGRTRTKLVSRPKKIFPFKLFLIISLTLVLIAGFFILNNNYGEKSSIASEKSSLGNSKILGSFIKLIGFGVSDEPVEIDSSSSESSGEAESIKEAPPT